MKTYVRPALEVVSLRVEERISGSCIIIGSCPDGKGGYLVSNEVTY